MNLQAGFRASLSVTEDAALEGLGVRLSAMLIWSLGLRAVPLRFAVPGPEEFGSMDVQ